MKNFDILSQELTIFGNHFLQASAGTGKTFAIQHLFIRLLLESDPPITIKQILVVTFTKAATRELKLRIRKNLEKTLLDLKVGKGEPYLQKIYLKGSQDLLEAQRKIEDALSLFDEANIHTIHSFCYRSLQQCAFELKMPLEFQDPETQDLELICEKSVGDLLRFGLQEDVFSPEQIQILLNEYRGDIQQLAAKIKRLVQEDASMGELPDFSSLYEEFHKNLNGFVLTEKIEEELAGMIEAHKLEGLTKEAANKQRKFLRGVLQEPKKKGFSAWLKHKPFFLDYLLPVFEKKPGKTVWNQDTLAFLDHYHKTLAPVLQEAKDPARTLLRLAKLSKESFSNLLEQQEILSFSAILEKMYLLSEDPICREKISSLFSAVIVDEFQDTDPLQWDIFKNLFLTKPLLAFYLVGDPKQSIYAFRSADVYTYLAAAHSLGENSIFHLGTSYRSTPSLIAALNTFFSSWDWMQLELSQKTLTYQKVGAASKESSFKTSLNAFLIVATPSRSSQLPSTDLEEEKLFPYVAQEILSVHKDHGIALSECAVLIKDRYQAERLQAFFKKNRIPCVIKRTSSLLDTPTFAMLQDFLQALASCKKIPILKKFLSSGWFPYTPQDLEGKLENPLILFSLEEMAKLQQIFYTSGFASCLTSFLSTTWYGQEESCLSLLLHLHKQEAYFHLQQLVELLIQHENTHPLTPQKLFEYVKKLPLQKGNSSQFIAEQYAEEEAVLIMTTHLSKGLEFEVVFALGVSCRTPGQEGYLPQRKDKKRVLVPFDAQDENALLALKESDAEKMRQLYVALTRAKKAVYLPIFLDPSQREVPWGEASPTELFLSQKLWPSTDLEERYNNLHKLTEENLKGLFEKWEEMAPISFTKIDTVAPFKYLEKERTSKALLLRKIPPIIPVIEKTVSFSSLTKNISEDISPLIAARQIATDLPAGAEFGAFFHQLMEEIIKRGLHAPFDALSIQELIAQHCKLQSLSGKQEALFQKIEKTFHMPIRNDEEVFCLSDVPKITVEMEFLYPEKECFVTGFVDAVFEHKGKYYLVDWKTNHLGNAPEDYTSEKLNQEMLKHGYHLQAGLYAEALARYLNCFEENFFEKSFGGCLYIFIRHPALLHFIPKRPILSEEFLRNPT